MQVSRPLWNQKKRMTLLYIWPMLLHLNPVMKVTTISPKQESNDNNSSARLMCKQGRLKEAVHILHVMDEHIDLSTYQCLLQECIKKKSLSEGRLLHAHILQIGFQCKVMSLWNKIISLYAKCGYLDDALRVLNQMAIKNAVSWTVLIASCARHGYGAEALALFYQMQRSGIQLDQFSFASVLPACTDLAELKELHDKIMRCGFQSDLFLGNVLIDMYAKCGSLEDARNVFDKMSQRDVISWNTLIAGYVQKGCIDEAHKLFLKMSKRDVVSWTTMIAGYAQNGCLDEALRLFENMPERNVGSWNAIIAGYTQIGNIDEALKLFQKMPGKDIVSWTTLLAGYTQNGYVEEAQKLFQRMPKQDIISWNAMIAGYAHNGIVDEALKLFEKMPERNVVSWNVMIAGYVQNGCSEDALNLFNEMQLAGVKPNSKTFASVLPACASLAALEKGKEIHEEIVRCRFQSDVFVGSALVDMYGKCGSLKSACNVFDNMRHKDVVSWTAMIKNYAMHGYGTEALKLFKQMLHCGTKPNDVTLVGVLFACCHAGLVDKGKHYFNCMSNHYRITPTMEHYSCMVDLLGRAGYLDEAHDFINKMPMKPGTTVWGSLLGACRIHNNIELGECAAQRLFELDSKSAAPYVLLSNMYGVAGRWGDIEKVRKMMKNNGVEKKPGCSWIEVHKKVYAFMVGELF